MRPADIRALPRLMAGAPEPVDSVVQRGIPGPGGWITIRMYRPSGEGPHPAVVFLHGGGFVFGDLEYCDRWCRAFTARARCLVVSVDYRLAPETRFPGAFDDAYAALTWVASNAAELRVDPTRIAVAGDSAGGNLAAAISLAARDRGGAPVAFQLLLYAITDPQDDSPSMREFADGPVFTRRDIDWCHEQYLRPGDRSDPRVAILRAPDCRRLPPAFVVTAGCDPLRDQGEAYAQRLREAGVEAVTRRFEGMPHGFLGFQASLEDARMALDEICAELRRRLGTGEAPSRSV